MNIEKLKQLMKERGVSQTEIAKLLDKSKSAITALMQGNRKLDTEELILIASHLKVPPGHILGEDKSNLIPVIGEVPGGDLTIAIEEQVEDFIEFSTNKPNVIGLRVKGNSMSRIAPNGAYIVVDTNETDPAVLSNKPVVILFNNGFEFECVFKIFKNSPLRFEPYSIEPGYDTIYPNDREWKIFGAVIGTVGFIGKEAELIKKLK